MRAHTHAQILVSACAVFVSACATAPPARSPVPTQSELIAAFDTAQPQLHRCYRDYVVSFGGSVDGGERTASLRGPTVSDDARPFEGSVTFVVALEEGRVAAAPSVQPTAALAVCWRDALEAVEWPAGRANVRRTITFSLVEER